MKLAGIASILLGPTMTPNILLLAITAAALFGAAIFTVRRVGRFSHGGRPVDAGAVSTQWLAELKRDEPWTRS